jgi:hypothetical protein
MASGLSDERIRELIADAHQDIHLAVPLRTIERSARREPRRRLALVAAAVAVIAAVSAGFWVLGTGGDNAMPMPGDTASPTPANGKPPRPTSSATHPLDRCADYVRAELAGLDAPEVYKHVPPPLRFELTLIASQLGLLLYADESGQVACWLTPDMVTVAVNSSDLTTNRPSHPVGRLSNTASAHGRDPLAAYTFGRVPVGTTRVEVYFPDGSKLDAQLFGEWYVLTATGEASHRFAEITKVLAYTPNQVLTLPVEHG